MTKNTMRKFTYILGILTLTFASCDYAENVEEQLKFLSNMRGLYGGSWNGSTANGCYKLEITNSERLNNNRDSIDYFGTVIGRRFIEELGKNYTCLTLVLVDEDKVLYFSKSSSNSLSLDLELINEFKQRSVEEYLQNRKAIYAIRFADNNEEVYAHNWISDFDPETKNPFYHLAMAHIDWALGDKQTSLRNVNKLIESHPSDDLLYKYIGIFYLERNAPDKCLALFKKAAAINEENNEHLLNIGSVYARLSAYDSSLSYFNKVIDRDSTSLPGYYKRALIRFSSNEITEGCSDLHRVIDLAPEINIPDSILAKCNLED